MNRNRWVETGIALIAIVLGLGGVVVLPSSTSPPAGADACPPPDTSVPHRYEITGYWVSFSYDRCTTRAMLQAIHRLGGDTVIRGGFPLNQREVKADGTIDDPRVAECVKGGRPCYLAALAALRSKNPANRIVETHVYWSPELFGSASSPVLIPASRTRPRSAGRCTTGCSYLRTIPTTRRATSVVPGITS